MHRSLPAVVAAILGCLVAGACGNVGSDGLGVAGPAPGAAVVVRVVDGDTLRARVAGKEEAVRLIGIDTPETRGRGGLRECFGVEASRHLAGLLRPGTPIRLVRDAEPRDRYRRLLAYVYRQHDDLFVNLAMAREGFAAPLTIPPNVAHADQITRAAARARQRSLGLWGRCGGPDTVLP